MQRIRLWAAFSLVAIFLEQRLGWTCGNSQFCSRIPQCFSFEDIVGFHTLIDAAIRLAIELSCVVKLASCRVWKEASSPCPRLDLRTSWEALDTAVVHTKPPCLDRGSSQDRDTAFTTLGLRPCAVFARVDCCFRTKPAILATFPLCPSRVRPRRWPTGLSGQTFHQPCTCARLRGLSSFGVVVTRR